LAWRYRRQVRASQIAFAAAHYLLAQALRQPPPTP
jgi:hypothetical protein